MCDEAHKYKSIRTKTAASISLLRPNHIVFLTATLLINKPSDLYGEMAILHSVSVKAAKKDQAEEEEEDRKEEGLIIGNEESNLTPYEAATALLDTLKSVESVQAGKNSDILLFILNPACFYSLAFRRAQIILSNTQIILRPILQIIQLRKTLADKMVVNEKELQVSSFHSGANVPPISDKIPIYTLNTVEVVYPTDLQCIHDRVAQPIFCNIGARVDKTINKGRLNAYIVRQMCLAAFSPHLELLIEAPERWKIPDKSVSKKK